MRLLNYGLLLATIAFSVPAGAVSISASNDWSFCQLQDTINNAGDYYTGTLDSSDTILSCSNAFISISGVTTSTTTWTVSSRLTGSLPAMNLELIRSGNGTGDSSPSGAESYITQSTAFQTLFTGQGNISSIPLQFRVRNFDVSDGHGAQNFQIEYQITTN